MGEKSNPDEILPFCLPQFEGLFIHFCGRVRQTFLSLIGRITFTSNSFRALLSGCCVDLQNMFVILIPNIVHLTFAHVGRNKKFLFKKQGRVGKIIARIMQVHIEF